MNIGSPLRFLLRYTNHGTDSGDLSSVPWKNLDSEDGKKSFLREDVTA